MKYLILKTPSIAYAKAISRFIYGISVPAFNEITLYYCSWIEHPNNGDVALIFPDNDTLSISTEANPILLVDIIRAAITEDEAIILENLIMNNQSINPIEHIPASLAGNIKTQEQMDVDGWFVNVESGV